MIRFCLSTDSPTVPEPVLASMALALEEGAIQCWEAWHPYLEPWMQDQPPAVHLWPAEEPLPPFMRGPLARCVAIHFTDSPTHKDGTLAIHFVAGDRPAGKVFIDVSSGVNTGRYSAIESAAHEVCEIIVNPYLTEWDPLPGVVGRYVVREVCDPSQRHYSASTMGPDGRPWQLANFTHPGWHGLLNPAGVRGNDHARELRTPGVIGPEGYAITRSDTWQISRMGPHSASHGGRSTHIRNAAHSRRARDMAKRPWLSKFERYE